MFTEDLSAFLADFGVKARLSGPSWTFDTTDVTFDSGEATFDGATPALSATVLFDAPDQALLAGRIQSTEYRMTYRAIDLPDLIYQSSVLISGTLNAIYDGSYNVLEIFKIEDGAFLEAKLQHS